MKTNRIKKVNIVVLLVYLICLFLIFNIFYSRRLNLSVGDVVLENIVSNETFENKEATDLKKEQARNSVSNVYQVLPSIQIETKNNLNELSQSIMDLKFTRGMDQEEKIRYLKANSPYLLSDTTFRFLLSSSNERITEIFSTANDLLSVSFSRGVRENNIDEEKEFLISSVENLDMTEQSKNAVGEIIENSLKPNEVIDEDKTAALRKEAVDSVEPVIIEQGDIIVLKGEEITEEKLDLLLRSGNEIKDGNTPLRKVSPYLYITIITVLLVLYIYKYFKNVYLSKTYYILLLSNIIIIIASMLLINISIILNPILLLGLVICGYVDRKLIIGNTCYVIFLIYYFENLEPDKLVYLLLLGFTLVTFSNKYEKHSIKFQTSIGASLVSGLLYGLLNLSEFSLINLLLLVGLSVFSGILSAMIAVGSGFLWESLFGILTVNKLQELSDTNRPLLRKLVETAPGTYQHSLMVANLAESATKAIGGDYHLAKAGALYHDIGKSMNPEYFKENQFGIENPHNELEPLRSAKIITDHVENGKAIGKKYKLPEELIKFIDEHHGDTLVNYFYYNAKLKDENTNPDDFRYKGKKPQSIETAVVMICDSCEAAVRSIKNKTEENIKKMINDVINGKIKGKQFNECDLSFSDIYKIKENLFNNFKSMYHERIEYPEELDD